MNMTIKLILLSTLGIQFLTSCKKSHIESATVIQGSSVSTPPVSNVTPNFGNFKSLLVSTADGFYLPAYLSCYNQDKTLRWRHDNLGSFGNSYAAMYRAGVVYFVSGSNTTSTASTTLYAFDYNTGNTIWYKDIPDVFHSPILRNDTLYSLTENTTTYANWIAAYNINNGLLLWRFNLTGVAHASSFIIEGDICYFTSTRYAQQGMFLSAVKMSTQTLLWQNQITPGVSASSYTPAIVGDQIYVTPCCDNMFIACNKQTGSITWTTNNVANNTRPIGNLNSVVLQDLSFGIKSYNYLTGTINWIYPTGILAQKGMPFLSGTSLYCGVSLGSTSTGAFVSLNTITGNVNYRKETWWPLQSFLATSNSLYAIEQGNPYNLNENKILCFDPSNGIQKDSLIINGRYPGQITVINNDETVVTSD